VHALFVHVSLNANEILLLVPKSKKRGVSGYTLPIHIKLM